MAMKFALILLGLLFSASLHAQSNPPGGGCPPDNSLELMASCRAPRVEGQVLNGDSLPAVGVFVVLVPEPRLREQPSEFGTAKTDQNGHFLLRGILPGDYTLFSWGSVEEGDWFDEELLKPFEDKGVPIHLEESDNKSIGLKLIETSPTLN
jgi:hypothetical protein